MCKRILLRVATETRIGVLIGDGLSGSILGTQTSAVVMQAGRIQTVSPRVSPILLTGLQCTYAKDRGGERVQAWMFFEP